MAEWSGSSARRLSVLSADLARGFVSFREPDVVSDRRLVAHELMHVLGLGHGCSWASVQTYCASLATELSTAADVAHFEVLAEACFREAAASTGHGLRAAVFGRRVVTLGLPPVPPPHVVFGPDNALAAPADWIGRVSDLFTGVPDGVAGRRAR